MLVLEIIILMKEMFVVDNISNLVYDILQVSIENSSVDIVMLDVTGGELNSANTMNVSHYNIVHGERHLVKL